MNTIADYLKWRGDITFLQVPYNEVDAYILSKIGALDLTGIVPPDGCGVLLKDAYNQYYSRSDINPDYLGRLNQPILSRTLRQLTQTERFGELVLSDFIRVVNTAVTEQISALTVSLPDGLTVVTFRGTDDTIVGWKENFMMAVHKSIPAQEDALEYLKRAADRHPGPLVIMGHSKGGNLALYAAVKAPEKIRSRIAAVFNFDGPGFRKEFWNQPGIDNIKGRIKNYVSQHTIVGALLTHSGELTICRSRHAGPMAHEAMFWEVTGPAFIREEKVTAASEEFGRIINRQLDQMSDEEIVRFVDDLFDILTSTGASTLTELSRQSPEQQYRILKEINSSESVREFGKELAEMLFQDKGGLTGAFRRIHLK